MNIIKHRETFLIADTHFNHKPLVHGFGDKPPTRPFSSVEEMNERLIENWNSVVKKDDKIYHLGDVLFGHNKKEWMDTHWKRLNGIKRLVPGNHDNVTLFCTNKIAKKEESWFGGNYDSHPIHERWGMVFSHVPTSEQFLNEPRFEGKPYVNVHGHTHGRMESYGTRHICVSVERINYTPIHISEVKLMREKLLGL